ncbi:MAG: hypothetical protein IIA59_05385 [Candidatus Marinimicrobia bacterium]|nr:hypothetical protein [Candidatus Neomarinimicrobiota bacterium]
MSNRYTVVFDAYHLFHLPMFEPVIDPLRHDSDFHVVLTISAETQPAEQRLATDAFEQLGLKTVNSSTENERKKAIRALNPDALICGWSNRLFRQRLFRTRLDENMNRATRETCHEATSPGQQEEKITLALSGGDPSKEAREKAKMEMPGPLDGKAAQRVRDALLERLNGKSSGVGRASPRLP